MEYSEECLAHSKCSALFRYRCYYHLPKGRAYASFTRYAHSRVQYCTQRGSGQTCAGAWVPRVPPSYKPGDP